MYLSRASLNLRVKEVRRDIVNPYDLHRTLRRIFPQTEEDAEKTPVLWRIDSDYQVPMLLLQSREAPSWEQLSIPHYFLKIDPARSLEFLGNLQSGDLLRFRLKANPTVTRAGKRIGLKTIEEQLEWLKTQGSRRGFLLVGAMVTGSQLENYQKSKDTRISIQTATFDGHLRVTDPALLMQAVHNGLGHAKAFGCGLLSLAKA
jgi:CRISPR system Cascade subunit CasE